MPLELLFQCGLLLAAVVVAFAIGSVVGVLVARLLVTPHPLGGAPDELGPRPSRPDPAQGALARRPPAESLGPVTDPVT
jgi:hypothetical protein